MKIALDATYSVGRNLSGVGVYSRQILTGLAANHTESDFVWCYRSHRILRSWSDRLPANCRRRLLRAGWPPSANLVHGLNQRIDFRGPRTLSTFHDLFVLSGDYSTAEFRARFAKQAHEAAERSDLIIAVSHFTARQVEQYLKVDPSRIRVIPHGARLPVSDSRIVEREPMILFVGAIQKRKNVVRLVEAFESVPQEWKLVLAGAAGFGAEEALERIEHSSRKSDIQVLGYVRDDVLEDLYARASIFAFPSLDEGFGMPLLEAMAAGTPVLTSNRSALPEVAGDAAVLVDPMDAEAVAEGLTRLAEDEGLRAELERKGRERAKVFTWERAVQETWAVYGRICGKT